MTKARVASAQLPLVSGTNIKTINGESLLGAGDIELLASGSLTYPLLGEAVQFSAEAAANFTLDGKEYLRTGSVKAYSAEYAPLIAAYPGLSGYGNDAKTKAALPATSGKTIYGYVAGKYLSYTSGAMASSDLINWTVPTGGYNTGAVAQGSLMPFVSNGAYALWASGSMAQPLNFTANGTSAAQVAGDFATNGKAYVHVVNDGSFWCALPSAMSGTQGDIAYIHNANPGDVSGWSFGNPNRTAFTVNNAVAGNGHLVITSTFNGVSQKLFTASQATPAAWTDRTATAGMGLSAVAGEYVWLLTFDGTYFVAALNNGKVFRATDPTGAWEQMPSLVLSAYSSLSTDRAGTIILSDQTPSSRVSHNGGATWRTFQLNYGKAPSAVYVANMFSFANGRWLANPSGGTYQNVIDLGPAFYDATPDFVGSQTAAGLISFTSGQYNSPFVTAPAYLRIK